MKTKINILLAGVGGQGTILVSDIISDAAIASGYDVKKTDTIGMAQRGGSVISNLIIGDKVWSPLIADGDADLLIAFEKLEGARYGHFLKENSIALINDYAIPPLSVNMGAIRYPTNDDILKTIRQRTKNVYLMHASERAMELGDMRTFNVYMLGSITHFLPVKEHIWPECLSHKLPAKILDINLKSFNLGRKEIASYFK